MQSEILITPELALVDPELAALARTLLGEPGELARRAAETARAKAPETPGAGDEAATVPARRLSQAVGRVRARALVGLVTLSIALNLVLALMLLSEEKSAGWGQAALGPANHTAVAKPPSVAVSSAFGPTSSKVERDVLAGLSASPAAKALHRSHDRPPARTGLGKLSATAGGIEAEGFRCVISEQQNGRLVTDVVDYPASSGLQAAAQVRPRNRSAGTSSASPTHRQVAAASAPAGKSGARGGDQPGERGWMRPAGCTNCGRVH